MFPWHLPYFSSGMYSPITFFMLWHSVISKSSKYSDHQPFQFFMVLQQFWWIYPLCTLPNICHDMIQPLYISIITTQPSPPSKMGGKGWTVKWAFIWTNFSYFFNLPSPTPLFEILFIYCKYCLFTLVPFLLLEVFKIIWTIV